MTSIATNGKIASHTIVNGEVIETNELGLYESVMRAKRKRQWREGRNEFICWIIVLSCALAVIVLITP